MTQIFKHDKALSTEDKAFESSVYIDHNIIDLKLDIYEPKVISSPLGSGKTTFSNHIHTILYEWHTGETFSYKSMHLESIQLEKEKARQKISVAEFIKILAQKLEAPEDCGINDLFQYSKWIRQEGEKLLIIHELDQLEEDALIKFLSIIKGFHESKPELFTENHFHLIIEGNCNIHFLTGSEWSIFALPQIWPPEFNGQQQKNFVQNRIENRFSFEEYEMLWELTEGDKFITQSIMNEFLKLAREKPKLSSKWAFKKAIDNYIQCISEEDKLRENFIEGLAYLIEFENGKDKYNENYIRDTLENFQQFWDRLPLEVKIILFKYGFVRKIGYSDFILRAPILMNVFHHAIKRYQKADILFDLHIPIDILKLGENVKLNKYRHQILRLALHNNLVAFHCGSGVYKKGKLHFEGGTLNSGNYEGIWSYSMHKRNESKEFWCIAFSYKQDEFNKKNEIVLLPIEDD